MTQARYFILNRDGQWKIKYRKELFGPYRSESEALLFAIDAAHGVGKRIGGAQVLVERGKYNFRPKWTYGQSPYPPCEGSAASITGFRPVAFWPSGRDNLSRSVEEGIFI